ncbi:MAG: TonB-dependent receptor [Terracidiphilus sp.]|nr:TonB-dependent receptor [Terracidiphilus sp.]
MVAGSVHDATGAVLPGADVELQPATGAAIPCPATDAAGEFRCVAPAERTYTVNVSSPGFAVFHKKVTVNAADTAAVVDATLKIDGTTQTVEVTANQLTAETTSTQLGETLDHRKIEAVPLNGRSFTDLMAVQPGIVPQNTAQPGAVIMTGVASTPPSGDANPGNLSISGQREASNGFRVNGSDVEEDVNMGTSILVNLDSIDDFRVLTSNFDAEYGNSSGGQILVVSKRGGEKIHGSAFEFLRNTALDARNYYSNERAAYRQNQFGGTVGGSTLHKSLSLFGDYQGTRLTEGVDTGTIAVPTAAERTGNFSASSLTGCVSGIYLAGLLSQKLGTTVQAGDPYSTSSTNCTSGRAPVFAQNAIAQSAWSAPAKALLSSVPQENAGSGLFSTAAEVETLTDDKGALRADWKHGRGTLTAYYFQDGYTLENPYPTGTGGASVPGFAATSSGRAQLATLTHTIPLSTAALNETHMSFMRNANAVGQPKGGVGTALAAQGFTNIVALKPSTVGVENVAFNDFTMGVDTTALIQTENIYELSDAFSRIWGHHGLKVGGEVHLSQINTHPDVVFNGSFSFAGSETGSDFADFLLGTPSSYTQGQANDFYNRNIYVAAFAQDSWKARPNLTLNCGVRWDRIRPWLEKFNQLQTLVEGQQSQVFTGAPKGLAFPGDAGVPDSLASARNNFSPRFGLAWSPTARGNVLDKLTGPSGTTSIRAGYGLFYTAYEGLSAGIMSANPPYGYTYTSAAPPLFENPFTVAATGANAGQRFPLQKVAFGASRSHPNSTVDWTQFEPLVGIPAVSPSDVTPYAEHWMLSVERELGAGTLARVSYVGAGAHHLLALEEANPADPALCIAMGSACGPFNEQAARTRFSQAFGSVELQRTIANSSYHALEATLNHRSHGLEMLASYTYAKSLDQSTGLPEPVNPVDARLSRGLSSFDMRHNFVGSFHYEIPRTIGYGLLDAATRGWAVAGIARFTSGLPVTLVNNNETSLLGTIPNGINNNGVDTPQWTGSALGLRTNPRGNTAMFDAAQFSLPALGTMGNARRRFFSGPGLENFDATLERHFLVKDDRALEMRLEAFNLFNHAQFFGASAVEGNISSSNFGQSVQATAPRLMQVAVRWRF